jgi:hypothetical protein
MKSNAKPVGMRTRATTRAGIGSPRSCASSGFAATAAKSIVKSYGVLQTVAAFA